MRAKLVHTEVGEDGVIRIVDPDLPPGEVDVLVLFGEVESTVDREGPLAGRLPLGGYRVGCLTPQQLRREAIYDEG